MKLINITSAKLTNKDFLGMYSKIATLAERITVKDLSAPVENYKKAVDALNEHLLANYEESTGHATCRCDAERNAAFKVLTAYALGIASVKGDTSCVNFIAGVNGEIEMRKEQLKSKSTSKSSRKVTAGAANAA